MMNPTHNDRRLRVLALIDEVARTGGGEKMARELTARLDRDRFERTLCSSRWTAGQEAEPRTRAVIQGLEAAGVRFVGLDRRSALQVWAWRPLVELMRRERIDILHAHMFGSNVWGAVLSRLAGVPVFIAQEQTWSYEGRPVRRFLDRELIARRADAFIAVSSEDRRRMIDVEGVDPRVIVVMPNAIPSPGAGDGAAVRRELSLGADQPVIGTVCRLHPQKALQVLVSAAAALRSDFPDLRVLIAGDGPERAALEGSIDDLELDGIVTLLGERSDTPDVIAALDVAVCCSDFEGTPLSVMEYMAAARPVVATRVGGVPDLIEHGVQGLLIEPRDADGLAHAVADLLRDRERAAEMGERGRERQRAEFDVEVTAGRLGQLYEQLYAASWRAGSGVAGTAI